MRARVTPVRYFLTVLRPAPEMLIAWLAVVGFALWEVYTGEQDSGQVLALVLFVQMFGASVGYRDRLLRGHFDPILAGRRNRWPVAAGHWLVAALPGLAVWTTLATLQWALRPGARPSLVTAGATAALLCVSTWSWAVSVPTTQYAGGTLWAAGLLVLAGGRWVGSLHALFEQGGGDWLTSGKTALAGVACPFLLTSTAAPPGGRTLVLTVVLCAAAWTIAAGAIAWFDAALEEAAR
ncbi:MAG: hypothetical protein ACM3SQ_19305 [Betaproteobacteria bacterium]